MGSRRGQLVGSWRTTSTSSVRRTRSLRDDEHSAVMRAGLAVLLVITLLDYGVAHAGQAAPCLSAAETAQFVTERVLPRWPELTPEPLRKEWPGTLREIARGTGSIWADVRERCAVYFVFAPGEVTKAFQLRGVRIVEEGDRSDLERDRLLLTAAFGPELTSAEERELRQRHSVSTSWRIPAALDVPGVRFIRSVSMTAIPRKQASERTLWQLEVMCDRLAEAPLK